MEGLKPCPFCGGVADHMPDSYGEFLTECRRCQAQGPCDQPTPEEAIAAWNRRTGVSAETASRALRALCFTRDYVGEDTLPAIKGWEWYDAGKLLAEAIPEDRWATEFYQRVQKWLVARPVGAEDGE